MWHEARKHERKLRGMMVDYKKRAERRREYYEKIVSNGPHCGVGAPLEGEALATLARSGLENMPQPGPGFLKRMDSRFPGVVVGKNQRGPLGCGMPRCSVRAQYRAGVSRKEEGLRDTQSRPGRRPTSSRMLSSCCVGSAQKSSALLEVWLGTP